MRNGIRDWPEKLKALEQIAGFTFKDWIVKVFGKNFPQDQTTKLLDSMRKWGDSKPTRGIYQRKLVDGIASLIVAARPEDLQGKEIRIRNALLDSSIDDFIAYLPAYHQQALAGKVKHPAASALADAMLHPTWGKVDARPHSSRSAIDTGRLDQKWHYMSPAAEENWRAVINSGVYDQYEECKESLDTLCKKNPVWRDFFESGKGGGIAMLGCGSAAKNLSLVRSIDSLVPAKEVITYTLVDFSPFMLEADRISVDLHLKKENLKSRFVLRTLWIDFVEELHKVGNWLHPAERNIAWMIPGGTLGNLNEDHFFDSVHKESKPGDLLVIGLETLGSADEVELHDLEKKYDSMEIRRFVEMPLTNLLYAERIDIHHPAIAVKVVEGSEAGHSKIRNSKTVEVSAAVEHKKVVLLTSTRYDEPALIEFAGRRGFHVEAVVPSTSNPRYKQFLFRSV